MLKLSRDKSAFFIFFYPSQSKFATHTFSPLHHPILHVLIQTPQWTPPPAVCSLCLGFSLVAGWPINHRWIIHLSLSSPCCFCEAWQEQAVLPQPSLRATESVAAGGEEIPLWGSAIKYEAPETLSTTSLDRFSWILLLKYISEIVARLFQLKFSPNFHFLFLNFLIWQNCPGSVEKLAVDCVVPLGFLPLA